ncbi:hypothetical protein F383_12061 [Gossypium arboreum]|uniref:Uncharacterized protein n=1 Tax=Gossypium arboreum TaxID=29729 RepID=A0A0B0PP24_GOSAR|nr:hypothetical protein F383_12061 [Gossypium arboreum]
MYDGWKLESFIFPTRIEMVPLRISWRENVDQCTDHGASWGLESQYRWW